MPQVKPQEIRCPNCYGKDIVPSRPRGIWDAIMTGMGRAPRHCRVCGKRFHPKVEEVDRDAGLRTEGNEPRAATS